MHRRMREDVVPRLGFQELAVGIRSNGRNRCEGGRAEAREGG
jgi:hypothetical protein